MSKPSHRNMMYAIVMDDEGELHDLALPVAANENPFQAVEDVAAERGIRFASLFQFQFDKEVL